MKTTRPNSAARAKELGENKGVAANGLTHTFTQTYYQQQMMIRADILEIPAAFCVHLLDVSSALPE
jgi:hypothetical protein